MRGSAMAMAFRALRLTTPSAAFALGFSVLLIGLVSAAPEGREPSGSNPSLSDRAIQRRAVEAVIWGMPVVNYDLMLQEMLTKTNGKVGQAIYWGRPLDAKNQTLTPNPDALYFIAF